MSNVIRSDVVEIGFDIEDNSLTALMQDIERLRQIVNDVPTNPINDLTEEVRDLENATNQTTDTLDDFRRIADDLGDVDGVQELRDEIDRVSSQSEATAEDMQSLRRIADRLGNTNADRLSDDLEDAGDSADGARRDLDQTRNAADDAADSTRDIADAADESENAMSRLEKMANGLKGALAAAAGAFAVGTLVSNVNESVSSLGKFQAQTGASTAEMEDYADSIQNLYTNAMGESMEDVANSMATVKQVTGMTGKELENTTNNALMMRDVFEFETNESIRAVDMMMKQFGVTSDEAYSMIAQGAQLGLNKNDDLLDTVNEYSVHFKQLGFNSEDMFNMLANGAKSGTFSVDKLGDAVKEFGVRVVDGSKTTAEGFAAIGLSADDMARKFKEGGETGKAAFQETIDALKNMEDPIAREAAGVALFGTMWEDLGAEGVFALSNISGEVTKSTDTLENMGEVMYQDLGSAMTALKRKGEVFANKALTPIISKFIQIINKTQEWVNKSGIIDKVKKSVDKVKEAAQPVVTGIGNIINKVKEFATSESTIETVKSAFERVKSIVDPIVEVVKRVTEEVMNIATSEPVVEGLKSAFEKIKDVFDDISSAAEKVFTFISDNIEWILPLVEGLVIAFTAYKTIMIAIKVAQAAYNVVMGITNAIMAVSPITWIVIGIGLLIGAIILCIKYWDEIKAAMSVAWGAIVAVWGKVADWFSSNVIDPIVNFFKGMWNKIKSAFTTAVNFVKNNWKQLILFILNPLAGLFALLYNNSEKFREKVNSILTAIKTAVSTAITAIVTFFVNLFNRIVTGVKNMWTTITTVVSVIAMWIYTNVITPIVTFVTTLWQSIVAIVQGIWNTMVSIFSMAAEWVNSNVITPIVSFMQGLWQSITEIFSAVSEWFGEKFSAAVEAIKTVFSTVVEFFSGLWEDIKGIFVNIAVTIGEGISDAFRTVVNAVIGFAENTINGFIRAINNAIEFINAIPGVSISTISELSIPRLAKGGVVDKPTIAEIGEDGKEAIVPLENNTEWLKSLAKYIPSGNYNSSSESYSPTENVSRREINEYNNYSPSFTVNLNGASATEDNKRKVQQWIKESLNEVFDNLDRNNRPVIEV